jgi:hypothetical protein
MRRGSALVVGNLALIGVAIAIFVAILVILTFSNNVPTGTLTPGQQSQFNTVIFAAAGNSLQLASVLVIVISAGLVISGIFLFWYASGRYDEALEK